MNTKKGFGVIGLVASALLLVCCDNYQPKPPKPTQGIMVSLYNIGSYKLSIEHGISDLLKVNNGLVYGDGGRLSFDGVSVVILKNNLIVNKKYYGEIHSRDVIQIGRSGSVSDNVLNHAQI